MLLLVSSREMANVSVVWWCPGVVIIGLRLVSDAGEMLEKSNLFENNLRAVDNLILG